jgi:hypothetical protein
MEPVFSNKHKQPDRVAGNKRRLYVYWSETDFFYEGQELRYKDDNSNSHNPPSGSKDKKSDRFFGHYNKFF